MIDEPQIAEYSAVRDGGAGLIDLSDRGRILVSGSEAVMFLNGLVTNDMKTLALNTWMPAAFANVQGRLLASVRILHRKDGFLIDTESVTREKIVGILDRFTLAGDFPVADVSDGTTAFSVQGQMASEVVAKTIGRVASTVARHEVVTLQFHDEPVSVIRATHTAEDGFDLFIDRNGAQQLREGLIAARALEIDDPVAETLRIEAGIPCYGIDMDETTVVTETNLDNAVSFTKGCYLGQEIIVRIKHRGHVAKKLTGVVLDASTPVPQDAKILSSDDKVIGRVASSTFSPRLKQAIALGYVKYDYLAPGTEVRVLVGNAAVEGNVVELPFVRGSWYTG